MREVFGVAGDIVELRLPPAPDGSAGCNACFAFVRYASGEEAALALRLSGSEVRGRPVVVTRSQQKTAVFLGKLPRTWHEAEARRPPAAAAPLRLRRRGCRGPANPGWPHPPAWPGVAVLPGSRRSAGLAPQPGLEP